MEMVLSGSSIKLLNKSINCLAKIGTELLIEAQQSQVIFRTLNSSRSAFLAIPFKTQYFDSYRIQSNHAYCSVLLKSVCTVFRTPFSSMGRLSILLPDTEATNVKWTLDCLHGIRKTYWTPCNQQPEIQQLALDRASIPSHLLVKPRDFTRLLSNFQSSLQEITLIATEPVSSFSEMDNNNEGKAVELRSYIDPVKDSRDGALNTQLWIDPAEELQAYHHRGAPVDVTFGVKELKAFLSFCESCEVDMHLYFEKAGEPILLAPKFGLDDSARADFDATLVLATMLTSQLDNALDSQMEASPEIRQGPSQNVVGSQGFHGVEDMFNSRTQIPSVSRPGPSTDHTTNWSNMTGSGT